MSSTTYPIRTGTGSGSRPSVSNPNSNINNNPRLLGQPNQPSGTLADLTACVKSSKGDIPPPLVGASITVLGSGLYVFGGRLVPTRLMIADLYRLDLHTLHWEKIWSPFDSISSDPKGKSRAPDPLPSPTSIAQTDGRSTEQGPRPRYFHSAEAWDHKLVIFGGMGYASNLVDKEANSPRTPDPASDPEVGLCVLDDLVIFDTILRTWSFPITSSAPNISSPSPRYAHLSCLTSESGYGGPVSEDDYLEFPSSSTASPRILKPNKRRPRNMLTLLGGQDISNRYIGEINVLDLDSMQWIEGRRWERHCGTYRSVACTSRLSVRQGDRFDGSEESNQEQEVLRRLSWSEKPSVERPEPVYLYSNFNFNDVRRDLELISYPTTPPPPPATPTSTGHYTTIHPLSHSMTGLLPNGLRFPTGTMIGTHLIVSGTSLNPDKLPDQLDCFAIWALDLSQSNHKHVPIKVPHSTRPEVSTHNNTQFGSGKVVWQRIDPGRIMMSGSWNRAVGWGNCLIVLGDKDRDIVYDYHHRQINFVDLAFIDLEAFAIYQPPFSNQSEVIHGLDREASLRSARLGLRLLRSVRLTDFEIVCADGLVIPVNRRMLEEKWGWFKQRMSEFRIQATQAHVSYQQQMRVACLSKRRSQGSLLDQQTTARTSTPNGLRPHTAASHSSRPSSVQSSTTPTPARQRHLSFSSNSSTRTANQTSNSITATTQSLIPSLSLPETYQVTPRTLVLPHPAILVQAILEYIYTSDLITPLHQSPAILGSMLVFATTYELSHLRALAGHALHRFLNPTNAAHPSGPKGPSHASTSSGNIAALIYEAATLSGCMALQIRSLKAIIATNKQYSTRPAHSNSISSSTKTNSMATTTSSVRTTGSSTTNGANSITFDHPSSNTGSVRVGTVGTNHR
ncbi:hypothetical protein CROQUDRAFT_658580 [Cronartium quercuum f. sp. fusiforme G11]|uniref:Uncharacterized protein n=1 Tax=Cronartium quercuum f. sp. fusiforme G11 TaxID=708437 RepID=A0A9P6TBC8_9BASI|nr:hypothetical protein CROQUDRAFT_658580 [Cronartium quercuum f. sp. fusiforme G11]